MTIRLMQWNCMYSEDPGKVADFIKEVDPDIVCLQELTGGYDERWGDTGALIAERLGYDRYCKYGLMLLPEGGQTAMGVGILSRYPLIRAQSLQIETRKTEEGRVRSKHHRMFVLWPGKYATSCRKAVISYWPEILISRRNQRPPSFFGRLASGMPARRSVILLGPPNRLPSAPGRMANCVGGWAWCILHHFFVEARNH